MSCHEVRWYNITENLRILEIIDKTSGQADLEPDISTDLLPRLPIVSDKTLWPKLVTLGSGILEPDIKQDR